jgi:hypothetical protein
MTMADKKQMSHEDARREQMRQFIEMKQARAREPAFYEQPPVIVRVAHPKDKVAAELMDAMEYLIADIREAIRLNPPLEAIGRNWAMRRAQETLAKARGTL